MRLNDEQKNHWKKKFAPLLKLHDEDGITLRIMAMNGFELDWKIMELMLANIRWQKLLAAGDKNIPIMEPKHVEVFRTLHLEMLEEVDAERIVKSKMKSEETINKAIEKHGRPGLEIVS